MATQGKIEHYAGTGEAGNQNGNAIHATFGSISGMVVDERSGALYVSTLRHTIRMITRAGQVSTVAGTGDEGSRDGSASSATFQFPRGIAIDGKGDLYVADGYKIRKICTSDGTVHSFAGSGKVAESGKNIDGAGIAATFREPHGVAVDKRDGTVYVTDKGNHSVRQISASGVVKTIAGTGTAGYADGPGATAQFCDPEGIAVNEADGSVFVVDKGNNRVRRISADGVVSTWAGTAEKGTTDGPATKASFYGPSSISLDPRSGSLFVDNNWWTAIRKISTDGNVTTAVDSTTTKPGEFNKITALAADKEFLYIAEQGVIRFIRL